MATFIHGNTIIGMLNAANDLMVQNYNYDSAETIGIEFDEFITGAGDNDSIHVIKFIDDIAQYMRFVDITCAIVSNMRTMTVDNGYDTNDDIFKIFSAINSVLGILD